MNIYDQLQAVEDRYEELGELLSDPDVVSDTKRFMELSKEEASTRDTVTAYREYKQVLQNIVDAEEMIKEAGGDADLEEMAKQELKDAKAEKEEYEEKLKILLLPKDPNDDNYLGNPWGSWRRRSPIVCWRPLTNVPKIRRKPRLAL